MWNWFSLVGVVKVPGLSSSRLSLVSDDILFSLFCHVPVTALSGRWRRLPQTQKLAMKDLKADAGKTSRQAEVNGLFVVQRLHSDSGLNTVEQLPSDYMWDMVEEFEERLQEYKKASLSSVCRLWCFGSACMFRFVAVYQT